LKHDQPFDNTRFYAIPTPISAEENTMEFC